LFIFATFCQHVALPGEVSHVRVAGVGYRVRPLGAGELLFDEQPYDYLLGENPK
jgi:hypothetical protein